MNKVPQRTGGVSVMLGGGMGKNRGIFSFQAKKQFGGREGGSVRHSSKALDLPTLNQIMMTTSTLFLPSPSPEVSVNISEPGYLQVQEILEEENGAHRLLDACRVSYIRLGSDDRLKEMFGKERKKTLISSTPSPPPLVFSACIQT